MEIYNPQKHFLESIAQLISKLTYLSERGECSPQLALLYDIVNH